MKKLLFILLAAALGVTALCACSNDIKTESAAAETAAAEQTTEAEPTLSNETLPPGNEASFGMSAAQLGESLSGTWVNQVDFTDKIRFDRDLTFTHFKGSDQRAGKAELDEGNGMLAFHYDDGADSKTYIWVDNAANLNANTWYIDGGTFAFGGKTFFRDLEI